MRRRDLFALFSGGLSAMLAVVPRLAAGLDPDAPALVPDPYPCIPVVDESTSSGRPWPAESVASIAAVRRKDVLLFIPARTPRRDVQATRARVADRLAPGQRVVIYLVDSAGFAAIGDDTVVPLAPLG